MVLNYRKRKSRTQSRSRVASKRKSQGLAAVQQRLSSESAVLYRPMLGTSIRTSLVYVETLVSLDSGAAGIAANHIFSANGMYDPNITGVGHQPRGFDEIMTLYDHFVVLGSKITVHAANTDSAQAQMYGISLRDTATFAGTSAIMDQQELGNSVTECLAPLGSAPNTGKLTMQCNPLKFLGKVGYNGSELKGSASANPAEQCYWHIWAQPINNTDSQPVRCSVIIEYYATFIEAKGSVGTS